MHNNRSRRADDQSQGASAHRPPVRAEQPGDRDGIPRVYYVRRGDRYLIRFGVRPAYGKPKDRSRAVEFGTAQAAWQACPEGDRGSVKVVSVRRQATTWALKWRADGAWFSGADGILYKWHRGKERRQRFNTKAAAKRFSERWDRGDVVIVCLTRRG